MYHPSRTLPQACLPHVSSKTKPTCLGSACLISFTYKTLPLVFPPMYHLNRTLPQVCLPHVSSKTNCGCHRSARFMFHPRRIVAATGLPASCFIQDELWLPQVCPPHVSSKTNCGCHRSARLMFHPRPNPATRLLASCLTQSNMNPATGLSSSCLIQAEPPATDLPA